MIPEKFKLRYSKLVDDPDTFFSTLESRLPKSFRVNTLKSNASYIEKKFLEYGISIQKMGWYEEAYVSQSIDIGSSIEHFLGHIYIQELVSMIPPLIAKKEIKEAELVLDAAAAPGSKTTQIAAFMENKGTLVANDISYDRIKALQFNISKVGAMNTIITNQDLRFYPSIGFDLIFLDAPCSSEGIMRKSEKLFRSWNIKEIKNHAKLQKMLIQKAFDLLNPDGTLIYSTCTFAPEENEEVVDYLIQNNNAQIESVYLPNFKLSNGVDFWEGKEYSSEVKKCSRIFPHHNDTGGFFIAKVKK